MILFGASSAGTKTYLLCRSDRHAFSSTFYNTLPGGGLRFCFRLEIRCSIWTFTISFQDDRTESSTTSCLAQSCFAMHTGQQLHRKLINFYPTQLCMALCISGLFQSDLSIWDDRKVTSDYMAIWLI